MAILLAAALLVPRPAAGGYVITPDAQGSLESLVGMGHKVAGCACVSMMIVGASVEATFICDDQRERLVLVHPSTLDDARLSSARFAVDERSTVADRVAQAVLLRDNSSFHTFDWTELNDHVGPDPVHVERREQLDASERQPGPIGTWILTALASERVQYPRVVVALLGVTAVLLLVGLVLVLRKRPRAEAAEAGGGSRAERWGSVALLTATLLTLSMTMGVAPRYDDFFYMVMTQQGGSDGSYRLLSINTHFRLASKFDFAPTYFAIANLCALVAFIGGYWRVFRQLGLSRTVVLVASVLTLLATSLSFLVSWACGFQIIVAYALIAWSVWCVGNANTARSKRHLVGWLAIALGLTLTMLFVKYELIIFILPLCFVATLRQRAWGQTAGGLMIYLSLVAVAAAATLLLVPVDRVAAYWYQPGFGAILSNAGRLAGEVADGVRPVALGLLGLGAALGAADLVRLRRVSARRVGGLIVYLVAFKLVWDGDLLPSVMSVVAVLWVARSARGLGTDRAQLWKSDLRHVVLSATAACLAVAPYLFNEGYLTPYYTVVPFALLAPVMAVPIGRWSVGRSPLT